MKMVKLSDFYPYDRNKGGIQELHHKIESKTLQYWGEDSGILIGITPIYKRRLWSEEVKVVNDKMTNMKTRTYEGVQHGDWVRCVLCGAQTGNYENGEWRDGTSRLDALNAEPFGFSIYAKPFLKRVIEYGNGEKKSRIR